MKATREQLLEAVVWLLEHVRDYPEQPFDHGYTEQVARPYRERLEAYRKIVTSPRKQK